MAADREPHGNEPKEKISRAHNVDGISFIASSSHVRGLGWQGRHIEFLPDESEIISQLLHQIPDIPVPGDSPFETKKGGKETVTFNIHQSDGWISSRDQTGQRHIELANADAPAIIHVLEELKILREGDNRLASHFCKEYGVKDDE